MCYFYRHPHPAQMPGLSDMFGFISRSVHPGLKPKTPSCSRAHMLFVSSIHALRELSPRLFLPRGFEIAGCAGWGFRHYSRPGINTGAMRECLASNCDLFLRGFSPNSCSAVRKSMAARVVKDLGVRHWAAAQAPAATPA